jgi:hypothetical protein
MADPRGNRWSMCETSTVDDSVMLTTSSFICVSIETSIRAHAFTRPIGVKRLDFVQIGCPDESANQGLARGSSCSNNHFTDALVSSRTSELALFLLRWAAKAQIIARSSGKASTMTISAQSDTRDCDSLYLRVPMIDCNNDLSKEQSRSFTD